MANIRELDLPDIGRIKLYKRRGAKAIRLTLHPEGYVRVSLPLWAPYRAGVEFAKARKVWIDANRRIGPALEDGQLIGKRHRLRFTARTGLERPVSRVSKQVVAVSLPVGMDSHAPASQTAARAASLKALKKEAEEFLPVRLKQLAAKYGFEYRSVKTKRLSARWGSCSNQHDIVLNIFLVTLPWELIDYVIIHELIHTRIQNHSADFWQEFGRYIANPKLARRELKEYQPHF